MPSYRVKDMAVTIDKEGADNFTKATYPIRVGKYSEVKTSEYEFHFNPSGQIRFIRGLSPNWRHPGELLKRTDGNDWVYYSLGSVGERIVTWLGEYYLPCPTYMTNAIFEYNPFTDPVVMSALGAWAQLYANLYELDRAGLPAQVKEFFDQICQNDDTNLHKETAKLHTIIGGRPSVLPPDTRHVDYEVMPLNVADGCRYHCKFCCVKSANRYEPRSWDSVLEQIGQLKDFYGPNLGNYKALFLGDHDALGAGDDLLLNTAAEAVNAFEMKSPTLFLFSSVGSLLKVGGRLFDEFNQKYERTYVNLGLESIHGPTLASIGKPLEVAEINEAFHKMLEINREFENIEITANFLLGDKLPPGHTEALMELLQSAPEPSTRKGAIYISPLLESQNKRELLDTFFQIKEQSKLPAYVYLIQRL
jgi:hypothetical protein